VDYLQKWRNDTKLLPNVADIELFKTALPIQPQPRTIAFAGAMSAHKVDLDLLHAAAKAIPSWRFELIGPVEDEDSASAIAALEVLPNVKTYGRVAQSDLPRLLARAEVLILPYRISTHTAHILPLKLFEYLATGRRVLSTPLPAIQTYSDVIETFSDVPTLAEALSRGDREGSVRKRLAVAQDHDWQRRIEDIENDLMRRVRL
jgi:glycosyltransferase involved in cell wall biosynthesis